MSDKWQNDEQVQDAAKELFAGVIPERSTELNDLWQRYNPRFNLLLDKSPDGLFVMAAGRYREVIFNHRALRVFWLASFIAWEGFQAIHTTITTGNHDLTRFDEMIEVFNKIMKADDPLAISLPAGVPEPGTYPEISDDAAARAAAELATFAVGWAFLHEISHLKHQQDGTSAGSNTDPKARHQEEFSCDEFATKFMLETIADYASNTGESVEEVRRKRELGIYFALFAMTLIVSERWGSSKSHPAVQERIDAVINLMDGDKPRLSDAIAHVAFGALWERWPAAPGPFKKTRAA